MANNEKHPQISLLLTRPLQGSRAFWEALDARSRTTLDLVISPLLEIKPLGVEIPDANTVIFSSQNGVAHAPHGQGRVAYCIGEITTAKAQHAGWDARCMGSDADGLVAALFRENILTPLLHLSGRHTRGNIAGRLNAHGIQTGHLAIYDQKLCDLTEDAKTVLERENPVILPLFSPRTARQLKTQDTSRAPLHIIALSPTIAQEVQSMPHASLEICKTPTRTAIYEAVQFRLRTLRLG